MDIKNVMVKSIKINGGITLMKQIVSMILVVIMICIPYTNVYAESEISMLSGNVMSTEQFKNFYGVAPEKRAKKSERTTNVTESSIRVSNVQIAGNNVSMTIAVNNSSKSLLINGKLCAGYKSLEGINSVIIEVDNTPSDYEVLYFEIFNDYKDNNLLVNTELEGNPHIKIYLKDPQEQIHLYEATMPEIFQELKATNYEMASKYKDALWAAPYVEHYIEEIPTSEAEIERLKSENINSRSVDTFYIWTNPVTYTDSFYMEDEYTTATSLPYVVYLYTNAQSATSTWIASFKVSEHIKKGNTVLYGYNVFDYRNVKLSFGVGKSTTILKTFQEGRVYDRNLSSNRVVGQTINAYLFKKAISSVPAGSTVTSVLSAINSMTSQSATVTLGSQGVDLSSGLVSAVGEKINSKYSLDKCTDYGGNTEVGHYFTYHADVKYVTGGGTGETPGVLLINFDVHSVSDYSTTPVSKQINFYYNAISS